MFRRALTVMIIILGCTAYIFGSDSTFTKPKRFFIDLNGGMTAFYLSGPINRNEDSGPNKDYTLQGGYSFQGNFIYQKRSYGSAYAFFCSIGYGINDMTFTENLNYNNSLSKFQSFSYSERSIKTKILNEQLSFCFGFQRIGSKISFSHKAGCFYSFASKKYFTNNYIKHESGSYLTSGNIMTYYTKDYSITDNFTFKESLCPYYGFECAFGNKALQPKIGFEAIYFTNDIVLQSNESNPSILAFGRALMLKLNIGLTFGF
jgi:hypothetical protein